MDRTTQLATRTSYPLILASASPARLALLKQAGLAPDKVVPADIDETPLHAEKPELYVVRVATRKAEAVAATHPGAFILAADTVACIGRAIIGKARDADHARDIIRNFSNKRHRVHTGLCVITPTGIVRSKCITTVVKFGTLTEQELEAYIASMEWQGKAGAFGIQGRGGSYVEWIDGSVSNVIGLPMVETRNLLSGLGFKA